MYVKPQLQRFGTFRELTRVTILSHHRCYWRILCGHSRS